MMDRLLSWFDALPSSTSSVSLPRSRCLAEYPLRCPPPPSAALIPGVVLSCNEQHSCLQKPFFFLDNQRIRSCSPLQCKFLIRILYVFPVWREECAVLLECAVRRKLWWPPPLYLMRSSVGLAFHRRKPFFFSLRWIYSMWCGVVLVRTLEGALCKSCTLRNHF